MPVSLATSYTVECAFSALRMSHLYILPLKPLVGVQDTDTNGNTSRASM